MAAKTNLVKVIRAKCMKCCCGVADEVKLYSSGSCALWPYRFGKNPNRKPNSEAQREAARANMRKLQESQK